MGQKELRTGVGQKSTMIRELDSADVPEIKNQQKGVHLTGLMEAWLPGQLRGPGWMQST